SGGRKRPRKKSSLGLVIGLIGGGVFLLALIVCGGVGTLLYFVLNKTIPETAWQTFSPPNSDCTILMPGTPVSHTSNILGITTTQYEVERKKEDAYFAVSIFDVPPQSLRPSLLDDVAKGSRDGAMAKVSGSKVSSETSISLGNLPGREYQ